MDLIDILQRLYQSEINAGLSSFWDGGFTVFLGDKMNGCKAEKVFESRNLKQASEWLHTNALKYYPDSEYAKNITLDFQKR